MREGDLLNFIKKLDTEKSRDAVKCFETAARHAADAFIYAVAAVAEFANKYGEILAKHTHPTDEMLESVATGKELHLMKYAKKKNKPQTHLPRGKGLVVFMG